MLQFKLSTLPHLRNKVDELCSSIGTWPYMLTNVLILFRGDGNFLKARQEAKKGELDEQLKEYINEWRKQRAKEEEELKRLKEKQAKRKEIRAEQVNED